jgi:hypothetical protein
MRRRNFAYILLTGFIFCYHSEWMFWLGREPELNPLEYLMTWLAYSYTGFFCLAAIRYFRVRDWAGVFLAGAIYGWITEGSIAQTLYLYFPLSISMTGLSWHALITVVLGWYKMRQWLALSDKATLLGSIGFGVLYGWWASGWWVETPQASLAQFTGYVGGFSLPLIGAYWGLHRLGDSAFILTRKSLLIVGLPLLFILATLTLSFTFFVPLILFPLLALVGWALRRNRAHAMPETSLLDTPTPRIPNARFGLLLAIPITATLIYSLMSLLDFPLQTGVVVYGITIPLGFILLGLSIYKIAKLSGQADHEL